MPGIHALPSGDRHRTGGLEPQHAHDSAPADIRLKTDEQAAQAPAPSEPTWVDACCIVAPIAWIACCPDWKLRSDVIISINQQPAHSPAEAARQLQDIAHSPQKTALLLLNRHGMTRYLGLDLSGNQG